jgi:subtilase-type serine protease
MADIEEPFAGNGDDGSLIERQLPTGTGGSLTKIRWGTLILSGANTHTGDTNVNRGVLQVDGSITSNTFVNHNGTLAGTGTVRPEGALGTPGLLTVFGTYTQTQYATLMIQIAGTSPEQFSALNVLGNANLPDTSIPSF